MSESPEGRPAADLAVAQSGVAMKESAMKFAMVSHQAPVLLCYQTKCMGEREGGGKRR